MGKSLFDFSHLTPTERVQLADELWESLADRPEVLLLTNAQTEELDRRLEAYRKDPSAVIPWREALEEIENSGAYVRA
jgi:putative addiction module component (TIGR02574 family)